MLKRPLEWLPDDVVELILERLAVKCLSRFKCVSKKWKRTIESQRFQEGQLIRRKQSRGADVLFVYVGEDEEGPSRRIVLGSSVICTVNVPTSNCMVSHGSCDGLVCLYGVYYTPNLVVNPATRWHQSFPISSVQGVMADRYSKGEVDFTTPELGFGKDKFTGIYKPVWLYNSSDFGLLDHSVTTCEVFDFSTNAWRYLLPASPYRILDLLQPVYLDGSLYWLTDCEEPKVISLDLHTETFQLTSKAPFARLSDPHDAIMCLLDNRLCLSTKNWPTQVVWSFDSGTWKQMCSIDLTKTLTWFGYPDSKIFPIAILDKNKLLLHSLQYLQQPVLYHLHTNSYHVLFTPTKTGRCVYYFESLFSVLPI